MAEQHQSAKELGFQIGAPSAIQTNSADAARVRSDRLRSHHPWHLYR